MKLTAIVLLGFALHLSAKTVSQTVTYSGKDKDIKTVLREVKKQTDFTALFELSALEEAHKVTITALKMPLPEFLEKVFAGQPLTYSVENNSIIIARKKERNPAEELEKLYAPDALPPPITGRIVDAEGKALAGASIFVKGSKVSTVSDAEGGFTINANEGDILVVSYVGYLGLSFKVIKSSNGAISAVVVSADRQPSNTEGDDQSNSNARSSVVVSSDQQSSTLSLVIKLAPSISSLQDVNVTVNTGYQTISKERATGSFTHINNTEINQQVGPNILNRINGIANGVLFDNNSQRPPITVRGLSTINGPKNPLIVVDNFTYDGDINNINPNLVESITILKDAAAASIWGTRAGNGVIVITTKKGKFNQPLRFNFDATSTFVSKPDLDYVKLMSTSDYIDVETFLYSKGFYNSQIGNSGRPALSPVVEILINRKNGIISSADSATQIDALRNIDVRNDFSKNIYQTGINQQYFLSAMGGTDQMSYNISGGYDRNISSTASKYERVNLRAFNSFRPLKRLQVVTALYYNQSKTKNGRPDYGTIIVGSKRLYPYANLSAPLYFIRQSYVDTAGAGKLLDWKYYALEDWKHNTSTNTIQDIIGNIGLQYEFTKDLNAEIRYQYEKQQSQTESLQDVESYAARNTINTFSQLDRTTGIVKYIVPMGGILNNTIQKLNTSIARGQLNYNKTVGVHQVAALAGLEIRQTKTSSNSFRDYGYNPEYATLSYVDYTNAYRTFINGSNQFIPFGDGAGGTVNRFTSVFGNAAYTFHDKYIVSGSFRKDASNLFGVKTNEKGVPLWSTGVVWNIMNEGFYHSEFIPFLKLRATYGFSGNVDNSKSAVTTIGISGPALYTNFLNAAVTQFVNPELRWERNKTINIGLDFQLKNDVIGGSVEFYKKRGLDLFGLTPIDYTSGLGTATIVKNVANMDGNGVDIALNTKIVDRKFKWIQDFNFNYAKNKVSEYFQQSYFARNYVNYGATIAPLVGKPVYSILSYKWMGLDLATGDPQGLLNKQTSKNYNGIFNDSVSNLIYNGSATPTIFGNFANTVSWKNLSLAVNITYKFGYYFRRESINYDALFNSGLGHSDYALRWKNPGDEQSTNVPSFIYPNNGQRDAFYIYSESLVTRGDLIRLQFINLSYDINRNTWHKLPFNSLRLSLNASNLGIIWRANKYGIDPDYSTSSYPAARAFSISINVGF